MLQDEVLLLWVFVASDGKVDELEHTYARTELEARIQLQAWMAEQVTFGRETIEAKHWPDGYKAGHCVYWPGSKPASQIEASYGTTTHH